MNDIVAAVLAWPLLTQVFVLAALILVPLQVYMRVKRRRTFYLPNEPAQHSIVQIAGDNATQIVNTGGGSFVVQAGGDLVVTTDTHGRYIVTGGNPRQAAKFKAELDRRQAVERAEAARRSRITNKVDELEQSTGTPKPPPDRSWVNTTGGRAAPQSLTEYHNGLLAQTWCAGCDQLVKVGHMAWTVDGLYRCRVCRGVTAVRECEADDALEPPPVPIRVQHGDQTAVKVQQLLHDVATYAEDDSAWMARVPFVGVVQPWTPTTPTIDPWLDVEPGSLVDQVLNVEVPTPPCYCCTVDGVPRPRSKWCPRHGDEVEDGPWRNWKGD